MKIMFQELSHCRKKYVNIMVIIAFILIAGSCKKADPEPSYTGDNFLYFADMRPNTTTTGAGYNIPKNRYVNGLVDFSFYWIGQDTIPAFNYSMQKGPDLSIVPGCFKQTSGTKFIDLLSLRVAVAGQAATEDRPFSIRLEGKGSEYVLLPPADSLKIPAGAGGIYLNLRLKRPALADTSYYSVKLILDDNTAFKSSHTNWSSYTVRFGNKIFLDVAEENVWLSPTARPTVTTFSRLFGDFSEAKVRVIITAINKIGAAHWKTYGDRMNEQLALVESGGSLGNYYGGRTVVFEPFTADDLLLMIYADPYAGSLFGQLTFGFDAFMETAKEIAKVTKAYLAEQSAAGKPVLDENGDEITLP